MNKTVFIAEVSADELALRLMQIAIGLKAPEGINATEALNESERIWPVTGPSGGFPFRRMAHAAMAYWKECIEKGQAPS